MVKKCELCDGSAAKGEKPIKVSFCPKCKSHNVRYTFGLGNLWSQTRRKKEKFSDFKGEEKEISVQFAKDTLKTEHFDYFVFGHRHYPVMLDIGTSSKYGNIGDWLINFTFLEFNGKELRQYSFKSGTKEKHVTDLTKVFKIDIF